MQSVNFIAAAATGGGGAVIDDATPSATTTYSSTKIESISSGGGGGGTYTASNGVVLLGSNFSAPGVGVNAAAIATKANDADVVKLTGNQLIYGDKTYLARQKIQGGMEWNSTTGTIDARILQGASPAPSSLILNNTTLDSSQTIATTANVTGANIDANNLTNVAAAVGHVADVTTNPHAVTKTQVGLGNADNTSDALKPLSDASTTALGLKEDAANKGAVSGYCPLDAAQKVPFANIPDTATYPVDPILGLTQVYSAKTTSDLIAAIASGNVIIGSLRVKADVDIPGTYAYGAGTITGVGLLPVIDGVTLIANDGVLLNDQTSNPLGKRANGAYRLTTVSPDFVLTRDIAFDDVPLAEVVTGQGYQITEGTLHAGETWTLGADTISSPIAIGNLRVNGTTNIGLNNNYLLFYLSQRRAPFSSNGNITVVNQDLAIASTPFASLPVSDVLTPAAQKLYSATYTKGLLDDKASVNTSNTFLASNNFNGYIYCTDYVLSTADINAHEFYANDGATQHISIVGATNTIRGIQSFLNLEALTEVRIQGVKTNAFSDAKLTDLTFATNNIRYNNYAAITGPLAGNDVTELYDVGSAWHDTTANVTYTCIDNATGAAIWIKHADLTQNQTLEGLIHIRNQLTMGSFAETSPGRIFLRDGTAGDVTRIDLNGANGIITSKAAVADHYYGNGGTVALPVYCMSTTEGSTGFYRTNFDEIGVSCGGVQKFRFTAAENVSGVSFRAADFKTTTNAITIQDDGLLRIGGSGSGIGGTLRVYDSVGSIMFSVIPNGATNIGGNLDVLSGVSNLREVFSGGVASGVDGNIKVRNSADAVNVELKSTGQILATSAVGSPNLPAHSFTDYPNSGLYMGAVNVVALSAAGVAVQGWSSTSNTMYSASGTAQFHFDTNVGQAYKNSGTAWINPISDARLKTNIVPVDPAEASSKICSLELVKFDYKAGVAAHLGITGKHTGWVGFLADQFDAAMGTAPEDRVKAYGDYVDPEDPEAAGTYHTVDTGLAEKLLFAAHQHAVGLIAAQQVQINALIARLAAAGIP